MTSEKEESGPGKIPTGGSIPAFFIHVQKNQLKDIIERYFMVMQSAGDRNFPVSEYGLSCYIQALNEMFEILDEAGVKLPVPKDDAEVTTTMDKAVHLLNTMHKAYLELKFSPVANVEEVEPNDQGRSEPRLWTP